MLASLLMVLCLQMAAQIWEDVKVGTSTRKTLTYVPKNVEKSPALVISLHGMNQDPGYQQNQTQWNALADTEGFIVTYPLGNNKMWDTNGTSDVKFVETVIQEMINQHHVDKNRIYLSGFSMGSWLGYHCLETLGDQIAAFGPVSGVDIGKQPRANRMVPISTLELWNFFKHHQLNQHPVPVENRNYFIRYESTVGENLWDRQAVYTLPKALEKGAKYTLTMKMRT